MDDILDMQEKEVVVLVTGYAPFLAQYPKNASWEICSRLPDSIAATSVSPTRIKIVKHPSAVPVCYSRVLALVPELLSATDPKPDIVLHMGLAGGRTFYTLESQSARGPYTRKTDMDGELFPDEENEREWHGLPNILRPTSDFDDVFGRLKQLTKGLSADVRPSDNPGLYLCGFIYYASMAWYIKRKAEEVAVMFLHVPDCPSPEEMTIGQDVTLAAIRALVDSRAVHGVVQGRLPTVQMSQDLPAAASGILPPEALPVATAPH